MNTYGIMAEKALAIIKEKCQILLLSTENNKKISDELIKLTTKGTFYSYNIFRTIFDTLPENIGIKNGKIDEIFQVLEYIYEKEKSRLNILLPSIINFSFKNCNEVSKLITFINQTND